MKMKLLLHVPNIILGAVGDDGDYAGDNADDNYNGDANCDYDQDYELIMIINHSNLSSNGQL